MILQNVGKRSLNDTVPHPRSLGSYATLLWVPHILHAIVLFVNEVECTDTTFEDSFGTLLVSCLCLTSFIFRQSCTPSSVFLKLCWHM